MPLSLKPNEIQKETLGSPGLEGREDLTPKTGDAGALASWHKTSVRENDRHFRWKNSAVAKGMGTVV